MSCKREVNDSRRVGIGKTVTLEHIEIDFGDRS